MFYLLAKGVFLDYMFYLFTTVNTAKNHNNNKNVTYITPP